MYPVNNVKKYTEWAKLKSDDFLFCNLSQTKTGYKIRNDRKMMTYTNLRDEFLAALSPHVNDISRYCLRSIRAGGASAAANKGVKDRMSKRNGRWISDSAYKKQFACCSTFPETLNSLFYLLSGAERRNLSLLYRQRKI